MRSKKLLHVTLDMNRGGLQRLVYDLVTDSLTRRMIEMHVCCLDRGGHYANELADLGVPTFIYKRRPVKIDFRLLARLFRLMRCQRYDVVHSHSGCVFYATAAAKLTRTPTLVHTEHGRYLPDKYSEILEDRFCSRLLNHYVCVSNQLKRYMLETVKIKPGKLRLIINGVDTRRFHPYCPDRRRDLRLRLLGFDQDMFVVGTVSRLQPVKNIQFIINWAREFLRFRRDICLVIVGDGSEMDRLKRLCDDLPPRRVSFLGARDDIPDLLNAFDVFVLPSKTEGTSLTVLEAMACGLPVVASDVGGNRRIIRNGENGFLFRLNNLVEFSNVISMLFSDKAARDSIGKDACDAVLKNNQLSSMINHYYRLYGQRPE